MKKLLLLLSFVTATLSAQAEGPGLKQQTYKQGELFKIMSSFDSTKHHVRGHAAMIMFKGYLAMVEAMDSGKGDAAFVFYDISDPKTPKRVASYADENTKELFEGHNYAFTVIDDRDIVFLIAKRGLQIWDWTDIHQPKIISKLDMPLLSGGAYDRTAWWVAAQYPKLYLGGTNTGLYIIDAKDLQKPKVDKRISINKLGGFKVGSVFACGNLLVANTFDNRGISLFDISNPLEPQLQSTIKEPFGYTTLYNGRYVYGIGETPKIWDISNAQKPLLVSKYKGPKMGSKGGYAIFQDGFLHQGVSSTYVKIDVRDPVNPKVVGKQSKSIRKKDWDGAHVVGNLTVIACDHGTGSHIVAHQCEIDKKGPGVNFASPANGSKNVATTSRIGFSFTDEIDHRSINKKSFMVREVGGKSIAVTWPCNNSLLNFTPVDGLKNNTTYEVILAKGGIKDQVENGIEKAYRLVFSTGSQVSNFKIAVEDTKPGVVNDVLAYKVLSPFKGVEYSWDFGDGTKRTAFSKNPEHKHQFNKAGRYQVILFARKGEQQASVSLTQIISNPLTAQAPKNSATLIYDKELKRLWNVNPDNNSLTVCDAKTLVKLREIPCGTKPRTLTFVDKQVWVVNEESTDIHIFDRATFKFIKKIKLPYGCQPYGILAGKNSGYVSTQGSGEVLR
ncbi:MAG: Ig-like domain-containing protein [Lentisphaeraceae bacterium]|nr:Ig-like domain-containing protein [Lentisphaeraceae bacterium]